MADYFAQLRENLAQQKGIVLKFTNISCGFDSLLEIQQLVGLNRRLWADPNLDLNIMIKIHDVDRDQARFVRVNPYSL